MKRTGEGDFLIVRFFQACRFPDFEVGVAEIGIADAVSPQEDVRFPDHAADSLAGFRILSFVYIVRPVEQDAGPVVSRLQDEGTFQSQFFQRERIVFADAAVVRITGFGRSGIDELLEDVCSVDFPVDGQFAVAQDKVVVACSGPAHGFQVRIRIHSGQSSRESETDGSSFSGFRIRKGFLAASLQQQGKGCRKPDKSECVPDSHGSIIWREGQLPSVVDSPSQEGSMVTPLKSRGTSIIRFSLIFTVVTV